MANVLVQDGAGSAKYLKSTGDGSNGDPFVAEHLETNSAAIKAALETLDDVVVTEDAAHSSGDKGIMLLAVRKDSATALAGSDGDYIPLIVDSSGRLHVTSSATAVAGDVAHDAADSGNPLKIGGKARTSLPTAVAADDRVDGYFDAHGRIVVSRGMHGGQIYSLAARTATPANPLQRNVSAQGVYIIVYVSSVTDTPSVMPQFSIASPLDDVSFAAPSKVIWQPATPITAAGTYVYLLHPGVVDWTKSGYVGITEMTAIPIPSHWGLLMNHADADSITYEVLYSYVP